MVKEIRFNAFDMNTLVHRSSGPWRHPRDRSAADRSLQPWIALERGLSVARLVAGLQRRGRDRRCQAKGTLLDKLLGHARGPASHPGPRLRWCERGERAAGARDATTPIAMETGR